MDFPYIIDFPVYESGSDGFLSFAESAGQIPFDIKRTYWIYGTSNNTLRGDRSWG